MGTTLLECVHCTFKPLDDARILCFIVGGRVSHKDSVGTYELIVTLEEARQRRYIQRPPDQGYPVRHHQTKSVISR